MPPTQTQNRKDLLQAYRLMTTRSALALIAGEPDSPNQPLRRRTTATVSGILIGVIVCVLFGVLGAMGVAGSAEKNLAQKGVLIIDKDTGTPYVPCNKGELCPALNYTSALLALKGGKPSPKSVSQAQLAGTKLGPTIGIMGLPQDLPTESNLVKGPWAVCDNGAKVSTLVGGTSVKGHPIAGGDAALVSSGGQDYVLWHGEKLPIGPAYVSQVSQGVPPRPVTAAFLNAMPSGPKFGPSVNLGTSTPPGSVVSDGKAGQVFTENNTASGQNLLLVLGPDGKLHKVNRVQALLQEIQANQVNAPRSLPPAAAGAPLGAPEPPGGLPATIPRVSSVSGTLCVTSSGAGKQTITQGATVPRNATPTGNPNPATVNQVWLPSGGGALIGMTARPGSTSASSWVLLSGATRYGLNGSGVAKMLGYDLSKDVTYLPESLVSVLPEGKGLDPVAAAQPASG